MRNIGRSTVRSILVSMLVITFFVGIVIMYYRMLYEERRSSIEKDGEAAASQSAMEFEKYLSTYIDSIKLSGYTLDEMIREKKSDEEIQDFFTAESTTIRNSILENSTGLYGYVNGRFFSGTNWEPPEDYEATERPWYIKPVQGGGKITILDPYMDVQTGNVMLAIGKSLFDSTSVVSVDVSLDHIQKLTEEAVASGNADVEIIINDNGTVVTHSDKSEVGKNYFGETGTLGAAIVSRLNETNDASFDIAYNGVRYIVYSEVLQGDWHCIAVKDATEAIGSLNRILLGTILIVIAIVVIISLIMTDSNGRSVLAEKLSSQLSSIANIYMTSHEMDLFTDSFAEIKSESNLIGQYIGSSRTDAAKTLQKVMDGVTDEAFKDEVLKFTDLHTLEERLNGQDTMAIEYRNTQKKWRRGRFIVSKREEGRVRRVLWLTEDIDKEKQERDKLIDMSERAIAASEAKSSFLSNMSHEIRTPINAVLGMNEMILRECGDEKILSYSENIRIAGHTLLGLVNDILDFSRIESGKLEIVPVEYDLSSMLNDLVVMMRSRADEKGLSMTLDFDSATPRFLKGDDIRLKQVITNILSNAVKYTEKGGVIFALTYEKVPDEPDRILLKVRIRDTGIGIKEEDMKKLFSVFERIEEKRNRNIEGTGLGMNITRSLLSMMGSSLNVESVYGMGSMFSFSVLQQVVRWEGLGDYEASFKEQLKSHAGYKERLYAPEAELLVVDDNPMNLMVFESLLNQTGIKIDTADSGNECLARCLEKKYDIIFLDHMMPEKDGIETLHELRAQKENPNYETPAICVTANAISGARGKYISEGFDDYLTKPIDSGKLEGLLISYLPGEKVELRAEERASEDDEKKELPKEFEALKGLGLIDLSKGINNSGSVEAYLPLLRVFYTSLEDRAEEIERFYSEGDFTDYTIKVHALKSSAKIIGADSLGEAAQRLEDAGKNDDLEFIYANHEAFMASFRSFKEPLSGIFSEESNDGKPEADPSLISEVYEEIRRAADDMDCDVLSEIFDEMNSYSMPEAERERWKKIREAADGYDYGAILNILE